jgi:hypothetical protein
MTGKVQSRFTGASILRVDPIYFRAPIPIDYDPADMQELTELCKRSCSTPRAYLTPERKAAILAMPPGTYVSTRRLIVKHRRKKRPRPKPVEAP